jgi:hypothetical protein
MYTFYFLKSEKYLSGNRNQIIQKCKQRIINNLSQIIAFIPKSFSSDSLSINTKRLGLI